MQKTRKSFSKRLKLTKNGKILSRKAGQNHFNAKERTRASMKKHRMSSVHMNNSARSQFLINM